MEIVASFVANQQASIPVQPGEVALDHPAMSAQPGLGVDALAGDPRRDLPLRQGHAPITGLVRLVGVELVRATAWWAIGLLDWRDRVDDVQQHGAFIDVRCRRETDQRYPLPITQEMVLRSRFATVGRVRPDVLRLGSPFFTPLAGMVELSTLARLQSIRSASPSRSNSARCRLSQTPASCQSRSRRQQVIPHPHPISWGSSSHWIPVFKTKTIARRLLPRRLGDRHDYSLATWIAFAYRP